MASRAPRHRSSMCPPWFQAKRPKQRLGSIREQLAEFFRTIRKTSLQISFLKRRFGAHYVRFWVVGVIPAILSMI